MKKYTAFATGFALIFALLFLHQCSRTSDTNLAKEANESRYISKLAIADKEISQRDSFILRLHDERAKDSSRHSKNTSRLLSDVKALKRRFSNSPEFEGIRTIRDTIILKQDTVIIELTNDRDSLKLSFQTEIDSMEANFQTMKGKFRLANFERDSLKNLKPDSNWGLGGTAGVASVFSNGQLHAGFGFSGGVTYRIPANKISIRKLFRRKIVN